MGVNLKEFATIIVSGTLIWSLIFSVGRGIPIIYLPGLAFGAESGMMWIGASIGWLLVCFVPGVPALVVLKRSKRFKKFVGRQS